MLEPGRVIERYTVEALLGEGGMAAVYRVRHNHLGTAHALKVLTLTNPSIRARLLTEGRVQAALQHPHAVSVQDVLDVDGAPGLLMELVDGPDLATWIAQNDYTLDEAEAIFRGIVDAVAAAHAQGLVHRDLKPANVLISQGPTGPIPKVADFGLAKILLDGRSDPPGHATRTGVAMGTPAYMAPEQIRDAKNVDPRADLFSLGCILYQLLTRRQAFEGADIVELFKAVTTGDYTPPREHVPDLPERFVRAIEAALQVERADRVPDCAALLALLDEDHSSSGDPEATVPRAAPPPPSATETADPAPPRASAPLAHPAVAALATLPLAIFAGVGVVAGLAVLLAITRSVEAEPDSPSLALGTPAAEEPAPAVENDAARVSTLCDTPVDAIAGYAQAGPLMLRRQGGLWVMSGERPVHRELPSEENGWTASEEVACTLPSGTAVRLIEDPLRLRGSGGGWVAIVPNAVLLPKDYILPETSP